MVSSAVLTKNEETNIAECLDKLKWCDEVLVIDDNSTDKTVDIAKKLGAKVIVHPLNSDFSAQRNFALEHISQKWVLFVDADERISYDLRQEITKTVNDISYKAFRIKRTDFFFGKELRFGDVKNTKIIRLVRRGSGKWVGKVHETWISDGRVGDLKNPIKHYPHPAIASFLRHINFYSSLRAQELYKSGVKSSVAAIIFYPIGKFLLNWIIRLGILDGTRGTIHALMMSFHSFLVRAKLYLLWKKISGYPISV